mmetsp:Transcript_22760/g.34435  ORF Transcript_22760/g.34435 Transcript_22760/m.34435 type:complete len:506 (+) Transcript_22760:160-1677(+)
MDIKLGVNLQPGEGSLSISNGVRNETYEERNDLSANTRSVGIKVRRGGEGSLSIQTDSVCKESNGERNNFLTSTRPVDTDSDGIKKKRNPCGGFSCYESWRIVIHALLYWGMLHYLYYWANCKGESCISFPFFFPFVYGFFIIEFLTSKTYEHLSNVNIEENADEYINKLCKMEPKMKLKVECYHTFQRTYQNEKGETRVANEKFVTYEDEEVINVVSWEDKLIFRDDIDTSKLAHSKNSLVKLHLSKTFVFEADNNVLEQKSRLRHRYKYFDKHCDVNIICDIDDFKDVQFFRMKNDELFSLQNCWIAHLLVLPSLTYRILLGLFSQTFEVELHKRITTGIRPSSCNEAISGPSDKAIFASMRFRDGRILPQADLLRQELELHGIIMHIIDMRSGEDIDSKVFSTLEHCDTFLAFGTSDYGKDTGNSASTYFECKYAMNKNKRIIPLRMIPYDQEFEHLQARVLFGMNLLSLKWEENQPMPANVVDDILNAINHNNQSNTEESA